MTAQALPDSPTASYGQLIDQLARGLLAMRTPEGLFPSNASTSPAAIESPSATVTAVALLALDELGRPEADFVCEALLGLRQSGAWPSQGGPYQHTLCTAWPLFSCLRRRPALVTELLPSALWLVDQQIPVGESSAAWGHTKESNPRPFHTAYAVNALLEFLKLSSVGGDIPDETVESIKAAVHLGLSSLLQGTSTRVPESLLWDVEFNGENVCLASTAISLHVVSKASRMLSLRAQFGPYAAGIRRSFDLLLSGITPDYFDVDGDGRVTLMLDGTEVLTQAWPVITENDPYAYWTIYFTPMLAVTLLDISEELGLTAIRDIHEKIKVFIDWIISHANDGYSGKWVKPPHVPRGEVWATAQSLIVLLRWQRIYSSAQDAVLDITGVVTNDLNTLANLLADVVQTPELIRIHLTSAQQPLQEFDLTGSAKEQWSKVIGHLNGDPARLLAIMLTVFRENIGRTEILDYALSSLKGQSL